MLRTAAHRLRLARRGSEDLSRRLSLALASRSLISTASGRRGGAACAKIRRQMMRARCGSPNLRHSLNAITSLNSHLGVKQGASSLGGSDMTAEDAVEGIRVFVHLARDKDIESWRAAKAAGELVGVNDDTPYGYGRAERMGCRVEFSRSAKESGAEKALRMALRLALGFDLLHAWRQREAIARADIVWTHTESQYLAVAAIARTTGVRPKLLGQ